MRICTSVTLLALALEVGNCSGNGQNHRKSSVDHPPRRAKSSNNIDELLEQLYAATLSEHQQVHPSGSLRNLDELQPIKYLNTSDAYGLMTAVERDDLDFFAMQTGCDAQPTQVYCSAATAACLLNSFHGMDKEQLPVDPIYAPYPYATADILLESSCIQEKVVNVDDSFDGISNYPYGLILQQAAALMRCHVDPDDYQVKAVHVDETVTVDQVREDFVRALEDPNSRVFINFQRDGMGQSGGGHFSPVAAYNKEEDSFLVLDIAKYKYPPFWANTVNVHASMQTVDSCGNWDFPVKQMEIESNTTGALDIFSAPDISEAAAEAARLLECQPAYRGYILIQSLKESTPTDMDTDDGIDGEDESASNPLRGGMSFSLIGTALLFLWTGFKN